MKIEITAKDYNVSDRLKELIEKKISKLEKYFSDNAVAKVLCKKEKDINKMEISISAKNGYYRAEVSSTENMYENIDTALPKIERQIVRRKDKMNARQQKPVVENEEYSFLTEKPAALDSTVVKTKRFEISPLTVEDAQAMLEDTDHNFYIYLNAETGKVNVIYRRNDGNYGVIEVL